MGMSSLHNKVKTTKKQCKLNADCRDWPVKKLKLKPDSLSSSWTSRLRTTGCHRSMVLTILLAARHKRVHPASTPAGEGWYSIYLPRSDGRLSWPRCLITRSLGIEPMTAGSEVRRPNHCATETPCITNTARLLYFMFYGTFWNPALSAWDAHSKIYVLVHFIWRAIDRYAILNDRSFASLSTEGATLELRSGPTYSS